MLRLCSFLAVVLCALPVRAEVELLTSIRPLQLIAAAIQDGVGSPEVLLPSGASPHRYALRPSDVRRVRQAQLFYWIGPDLEGFLPRILAERSAPSLALQTLPGLQLRHFGETQPASAETAHDEHDDHDHDHRPGTLDAHLWLSPHNARVIAARMAGDLAAQDPANAARYQANLAAFETRLAALDARLSARLRPLQGKPFFVFHEAYDYFEASYGLRHAGVFSLQGDVQPGARHVAQMRDRLQAAGASCVFSEPPLRPRLADTLSAGLPVRLAELDAMGADLALDGTAYERLLEQLGDGLADCLMAL